MKYKATFKGRKFNASGIFYDIETTVEGDNVDDARIRLYENFDTVLFLKLELIEGEGEVNNGQG